MAQIPTRLLILQRLTALLQGVVTPDFDLSGEGGVLRGRNIIGIDPFVNNSRDHLVALIESPRVDAATLYTADWNEMRHDGWIILLQGICKDDGALDAPDRAYHLQAAVEQQLSRILATDRNGDPVFQGDFNLGGLLSDIEIGPPVVRPPEDLVSASAFFFQPIRLHVPQLVSNPYTTV